MAGNKFYWLKLKRDFFKRHDIRIIESMPNGKDYVLFYLKLLCESIDHEGRLRFSDAVPYSADMLAVITNTNVDVVKSAIKLFLELDMMECMDNGTFYMTEVERMTGSATDNPNANRQRAFRERKKVAQIEQKDNHEQEFNELWKLYPRKQGKQSAYTKYVKARKNGTSYEEVKNGIDAYNRYIEANHTEPQYIKQGSTWFNGQCWNDDYSVTAPQIADNHGISRDEDLDAMMMRRMFHSA